jgi:hypothetical protein
MSMGAERAEAQQPDERWNEDAFGPRPAASPFHFEHLEDEETAPAQRSRRGLAIVLVILAIGWTGLWGFMLSRAWPNGDPSAWVTPVSGLCAPLALFRLVWIAFGRTARRESERFTLAVAQMRRETQALESILAIVGERITQNSQSLGEQSSRLMALGDEAADRLGRVTQHLAREGLQLQRHAEALDNAADSARVDIGVLMSDLPRAEEQARAAAESMRSAGLAAHEQSAALEGHLAALAARAREADDVVGGAAQRLGAQVARIETGAAAAGERMDQVAAQLGAAVDGAMARASEAIEQARSSLSAHGEAMLSMVEQSRGAFEQAGAESTRALADRIALIGERIDGVASSLAEQAAASGTMLDGLDTRIGVLKEQLVQVGEGADVQNARVSQSIAALHDAAAKLHREIEQGSLASGALIDRTHEVAGALTSVSSQLRELLVGALGDVEGQAARTKDAVKSVVPAMEDIQAAAALAAGAMNESETSMARQQVAIGELADAVRDCLAGVSEADGTAARLVQETGPQLIEALVRVRETAGQAATHAREAIAGVIPESVARLTDASRTAIAEALGVPVEDQLAEIAGASQRAMTVARQASERLTRQLLAMTQTAAAIEDRIAEDQAKREEVDAASLTRRVALLVEALNSTAIDVNKLLSNDVADTAWAAYLKGDRGVFTRRAVRLLDSGEAREIQRHYEADPDFREQVGRYVHDFESMLRRVLAERDGSTLAVTLLSSDVGKLYVALAQAIERLRR